jgi:hypothetical protein
MNALFVQAEHRVLRWHYDAHHRDRD